MEKYILALEYFPRDSPDTARRHLNSWINRCNPLNQALLATGYTPSSHHFTQKQVELIKQYLGDP